MRIYILLPRCRMRIHLRMPYLLLSMCVCMLVCRIHVYCVYKLSREKKYVRFVALCVHVCVNVCVCVCVCVYVCMCVCVSEYVWLSMVTFICVRVQFLWVRCECVSETCVCNTILQNNTLTQNMFCEHSHSCCMPINICMCKCTYIYMYIYIYKFTYTYKIYVYIYTRIYIDVYIYTYIYVCIYIYIYWYIYICLLKVVHNIGINQCKFRYTYIHIYMYIYIYTHIWIHTFTPEVERDSCCTPFGS